MILGIPDYVIQLGHLAIGVFIAYIGYKKMMNKNIAKILLLIGIATIASQGYKLYLENIEGFGKQKERKKRKKGQKNFIKG